MAFVKGQSGNPSGRPTHRMPDGRTISEAARDHAQDALNVLASIAKDGQAPFAARVSAASTLLDRGFGKPTQPISGDDDMAPIAHALDVSKLSVEALREIAAAT